MALTAKKVYAILKHQISDMEAKLNSPVRYRGTVATADLLPLNPDIGDMYNIESKSVYGEAGMNVAWNGVVWDTMGAPIDMSLYLTKEEAETVIQRLVTEYFEKNPVKPGATTEQAQQIEQNKTDIASLKTETGSLKEDLSNKITKFYASNQGETHITDSDNGKIQDMMLYGRSEQKQYSGKNLLNVTLQTTTMNGVTFTTVFQNKMLQYINIDGTATNLAYVLVDINLKANTKYILSGWYEGAGNTFSGVLRNINLTSQYAACLNTPTVFTVPDDGTYRLMIRVENNATISDKKIYPMIRLASVDDDAYEPYVGGQPSPSPDYPQEIKSVVNPTVKVCGKNLLNATLQTTTVNGVTCTANGDGTYTLNGTATTITTFDIAQDVSCSSFRLVGCPVGGAHDASYELQARTNNLIYGYDTGDGKNIKADENFFIRIRINAGINCNNLLFKPMIVDASLYPDATYDDFEPYHKQTVTLPYTLNAIPVSSGGNVTIDGQQYIADYVDVERGKLVRMVEKKVLNGTENWNLSERSENRNGVFQFFADANIAGALCDKAIYESLTSHYGTFDTWYNQIRFYAHTDEMTVEEWRNFLSSNNHVIYIVRNTPVKTDLTKEEITAFKTLATYYPTTNISVNSEQLDGYTVFNYPISMANGWNYVKKQLNDNRDYIYDMDIQSAEAYVNSEYAVVLTELEV